MKLRCWRPNVKLCIRVGLRHGVMVRSLEIRGMKSIYAVRILVSPLSASCHASTSSQPVPYLSVSTKTLVGYIEYSAVHVFVRLIRLYLFTLERERYGRSVNSTRVYGMWK